jgi:RimJ/RimL family protein N-acetyltransferase
MDWTIPTIEAQRIALRSIEEGDVDALYTIFSNAEVMRYWSTPPIPDREAAVQLLRGIRDSLQRHEILKWGIATRTDNALIGTITLFNLSFTHRRCEIGYCLGRDYWGKGYMHEALDTVLKHAFEVLNLHRIEADVDPRNQNSVRMLEKLGFQREGYLRERWQVGGEIQDAFFYGLLRPEWKATYKSI